MQTRALPVLFTPASPALPHNRLSDTVEWTHFSTLTTTLPPGPWLWTVTPIHWSSLLSDEGSAVESSTGYTQLGLQSSCNRQGNNKWTRIHKQLLNCLDSKSNCLVNSVTQSRKMTSHLKKMGKWFLVWMFHKILSVKYPALPGDLSPSLTPRILSPERHLKN